MKNVILMIVTLISASALARTHKADRAPQPSLGTNFYFNAVTVHGRYETPDESIVTVEDDKKLGDLLDYRTNYKNRLAEETDTRSTRGGVR